MNQDKIGKFIYELRTEKKLSQYQLADIIPISRQAISKWERGETIPDSSTLVRLSEIFDVTINELLKGERLNKNSIEQLEKTTLNILDESNKNRRKIKRNFIISLLIILTLLTSFLSYYFINSYNSVRVYTISFENQNVEMHEGVLMTTGSKVYMKMSEIKNNNELEIVNMKLYYNDNKNHAKTICEDKDIENYTVIDQKSYKEKESIKDLNSLTKNSYIEITYLDNTKDIIKLKFDRNFKNNELFALKITEVMNNKKNLKSVSTGLVVGEIGKKEEPKKEETQEEIKIEEKVDSIVNEMANLETPAPTIIHDSTLTSEKNDAKEKEILSKSSPKEENVFDKDKILENLMSTSFNFDGTFIYENEEDKIMILYYESLHQLTAYKNDEYIWDYYDSEDRYNCSLDNPNCKKEIIETLNKYFK